MSTMIEPYKKRGHSASKLTFHVRPSSPQSEAETCMMAFSSAETTLYPTPLETYPVISPFISPYII